MADQFYAGQMGEMRSISTAGGGTALTTTASFLTLIPGTGWISLTPRNLSTAVVVKIALNPYLVVLKTTDALATAANLTDASEAVQDAGNLTSSALVMNSFNTAAAGNYLYVGSHRLIRGVRVTIGNTNSAGGSVLTVKYWKSGTPNAWTSIGATDGTSSTDTFRQTGNVTWTVPTDALKRSLIEISDDLVNPGRSGGALTAETTINRGDLPQALTASLYWTRWETSVQFDVSVTVTEMQAMARNTAQYSEWLSGQPLETSVHRGVYGIGCVEALTDAGTANLVANVGVRGSGGGFA